MLSLYPIVTYLIYVISKNTRSSHDHPDHSKWSIAACPHALSVTTRPTPPSPKMTSLSLHTLIHIPNPVITWIPWPKWESISHPIVQYSTPWWPSCPCAPSFTSPSPTHWRVYSITPTPKDTSDPSHNLTVPSWSSVIPPYSNVMKQKVHEENRNNSHFREICQLRKRISWVFTIVYLQRFGS